MIIYDDPVATAIAQRRQTQPHRQQSEPVTVPMPVRQVEPSVVYDGSSKGRPTTNSLMRRILEAK